MAETYYAVAVGRRVGIFEAWEEANASVLGFKNNVHQKFKMREEAEEFVKVNRKDIAGRGSSVLSRDVAKDKLPPVAQSPSPTKPRAVIVIRERVGAARMIRNSTTDDASSASSTDTGQVELPLVVPSPTEAAPKARVVRITPVKTEPGQVARTDSRDIVDDAVTLPSTTTGEAELPPVVQVPLPTIHAPRKSTPVKKEDAGEKGKGPNNWKKKKHWPKRSQSNQIAEFQLVVRNLA